MALHESTRQDSPSARHLFALVSRERRDIGTLATFSVMVGLSSLVVPIAVQSVVNTMVFTSLLQPIVVLTGVVLVILVVAGAFRLLQVHTAEVMQRRIFAHTALEVGERLTRVDTSVFDRARGHEIINRFFDVVPIQKAASLLLLDGIALVLSSIIGMVLLAFYHPTLLAFDIVLIAAVSFILLVLGRGGSKTAVLESKKKYLVAAWLQELARNPLSFRHPAGARYAVSRADANVGLYLDARAAHFRVLLRQNGATLLLQALASAALLGVGGWLVKAEQLSVGQLVAAEIVVTALVSNFARFGKYLESYYDLVAASDKVGQLYALPTVPERETPRQFGAAPAALRLVDLGFRYASDVWALRGVDLELGSGARVLVSGRAGSGKSTLTSLVAGLRSPTLGRVELDGLDLREVSSSVVAAQVGVTREIEIFDGTVLENVRAGLDIDLSEVRAVLDELGVLDDIARLPEGLLTPLHSSQLPLSRSRLLAITLARAMLRKPRLLLLDQTLDAMDEASRERALTALLDKKKPWTLLVTSAADTIAPHFERHVRLEAPRVEREALAAGAQS